MAKQVKDFNEGERIETCLLISNLVKGTTNSGAPYLSLTLQDSSKAIEAKLWDVKPELAQQLEVGKVYDFDLEVIKYKNNLQGKVLKVMPIAQANINMDDFLFTSPISKDELRKTIQDGINKIKNENIARIVSAMLNFYENDVYEYPAASKIHHNFIGGLATHTSGMLKIAMALCEIYPNLNSDYLIAGVILHDLGKIEEIASPAVAEYSKEGKLLGHISIMSGRLAQLGAELKLEDSQELLILRHMVLSHHGEYEYGSPIRPETLEAEILSQIDNIDAKINIISKALEEVECGEFTQKLFAMDNRQFYKYE